MKDYIEAPQSIVEFAKLLEDGNTVYLKTGTDIYPKDFVRKLRDQILLNEGVFESDTRIVTQAVVAGDVAPRYSSSFGDASGNIGLLFYLQR